MKNSRLSQDIPISINDRVILPFLDGFIFTKNKVLAKISEFAVPKQEAQWLSSRVLNPRPRGRWFEALRRHCVVVLEQDTFILA